MRQILSVDAHRRMWLLSTTAICDFWFNAYGLMTRTYCVPHSHKANEDVWTTHGSVEEIRRIN